jgi:hypothetical protein
MAKGARIDAPACNNKISGEKMNCFKRVLLAASLVATGMAAATSQAADTKPTGSGPNPYTDCGIGAALFKETHWAAVTSNVIWDLGLTALTSATSSPETCKGSNVAAAKFIGTSYEVLAEQTAAGKGTHLVTALNLFGCSASQQASAIKEVRASMGKSVAAPGYMNQSRIEKAAVYYSAMEQAAAHSCAA